MLTTHEFLSTIANIKGALSDSQPHPPLIYETYGDFGT